MSSGTPERKDEQRTQSRSRLGVLFSGGGRTLENLARACSDGSVPAEIVCAVSSHAGVGGIARAEAAGVPVQVFDYREHGAELSARIVEVLDAANVDWIILAGFIRYFEIPERYRGRVVNIHPSLLPSFGGKGFYGDRVHRAVIESGVKISGCTVHLVDAEYDQGPILLQRVVPVLDDDTPDALAARVFAEECVALPDAMRLCLTDRILVDGRRATLREETLS